MSADGNLRRLFRMYLPQVDFLAVETHSTSRGVPDVNYCVDACEGWIEMKEMRGTKVRVSPEQVGWAERRIRHGGRVLVAVRRRSTSRSHDMMMLFAGDQLRLIRRDGDTQGATALGSWYGTPSAWDWAAVLAHMRG